MNVFKTIKSFFIKPPSVTVNEPVFLDIEAYVKKHLAAVEEKIPRVAEKFGKDFNLFFFDPKIEMVIKKELLSFLGYAGIAAEFLYNNHWSEKHVFNFPGPLYTGQSDTCGTGDTEAPANVMYDSYCCEYIFKQPQSYAELLCTLSAASVEAFDSYSCNGNKYWTYATCKEWWRNRSYLIEQLNDPELKKVNGGREQHYIDYLRSTAENDLQKYCFFLENNYYPGAENVLPNL